VPSSELHAFNPPKANRTTQPGIERPREEPNQERIPLDARGATFDHTFANTGD
jgi:hypothetical protein